MKSGQLAILVLAVVAVGGDRAGRSRRRRRRRRPAATPPPRPRRKAPAGAVEVTFAYSPEKEPLLEDADRARSTRSGAKVGGKPVFVARGRSSARATPRRGSPTGGFKPVAWSPASSLWGRLLNFEADRALAPDENPSIVRTPLVIAMWEPMAQALGYPKKPIGFDDILAARAVRARAGPRTAGRSSAASSSSTPTRTSRPPGCRRSSPSTTRRPARRRDCGPPT